MFAAAGPFELPGIAIRNLRAHIIPTPLVRRAFQESDAKVSPGRTGGPGNCGSSGSPAPRVRPCCCRMRRGLRRAGPSRRGSRVTRLPGVSGPHALPSPARSTTRWWRDRPPAGTRGRSCFRDCGPLRDPHPARSGVRRTDVPTGGAWPRFFRGCSGVAPLMQWRGSRVPDSFAGKRELSRPAVEALRACSASGRFAPGAGGAVRVTRRCRWRPRGRLAVAAQGRELQCWHRDRGAIPRAAWRRPRCAAEWSREMPPAGCGAALTRKTAMAVLR